jgi:5-methylcytosine-specific restriction endonuclease McrA
MKKKCRKCGAEFEARACGQCSVARTAAWRKRNPERTREIAKTGARRLRRLHPERLSKTNKKHYARIRSWRVINSDRVSEYNRKHIKKTHGAAQKRWAKANPLKLREFKARRRASESGGTVDYDMVLCLYGMICHICEQPIPTDNDLEFDHVVPLSRGGLHQQENVRPSHQSCNRQKSNLIKENHGRHNTHQPRQAA